MVLICIALMANNVKQLFNVCFPSINLFSEIFVNVSCSFFSLDCLLYYCWVCEFFVCSRYKSLHSLQIFPSSLGLALSSLVAQLVENPPAMQGALVQFLAREDLLE